MSKFPLGILFHRFSPHLQDKTLVLIHLSLAALGKKAWCRLFSRHFEFRFFFAMEHSQDGNIEELVFLEEDHPIDDHVHIIVQEGLEVGGTRECLQIAVGWRFFGGKYTSDL